MILQADRLRAHLRVFVATFPRAPRRSKVDLLPASDAQVTQVTTAVLFRKPRLLGNEGAVGPDRGHIGITLVEQPVESLKLALTLQR